LRRVSGAAGGIAAQHGQDLRPSIRFHAPFARFNERYIEFRDQYTCAREDLADKLADEILQIADDSRNDTYLDAMGNVKVNHGAIARSRLQIDARKWLVSKLAPKKYGDGVRHENSCANNERIKVKSTVTFVDPPNRDEDGNVIKDDED